jgi:hypothetical protein
MRAHLLGQTLSQAQARSPFARYRQDVLHMVSDEQILTLAGEGDMRNLWKLYKLRGIDGLRRKLSQALGQIEHETFGGANAPEWTVPCHNLLIEVFARTVATQPCPR